MSNPYDQLNQGETVQSKGFVWLDKSTHYGLQKKKKIQQTKIPTPSGHRFCGSQAPARYQAWKRHPDSSAGTARRRSADSSGQVAFQQNQGQGTQGKRREGHAAVDGLGSRTGAEAIGDTKGDQFERL